MFQKKKQEEKKVYNYTEWEKDLGFLNLILSRKKGIVKEFVIGVYSSQKSATDYLTDDELEPKVIKVVEETMDQLGDNYKNFLIEKYFGTEKNLINFISEDVYVDLTSDSINRNINKIRGNLQKELIKNVGTLNTQKNNRKE